MIWGFGKISREAASADAAAVPPVLRMRYGEAHPSCFCQMALHAMRTLPITCTFTQIMYQSLVNLYTTAVTENML